MSNNLQLETLLKERGDRYGEFKDHARYSQELKSILYSSPNWHTLTLYQKEGLEMVCHKIARILNGSTSYLDTIRDCIGYFQLIYNELEKSEGSTDVLLTNLIFTNGNWEKVEK